MQEGSYEQEEEEEEEEVHHVHEQEEENKQDGVHLWKKTIFAQRMLGLYCTRKMLDSSDCLYSRLLNMIAHVKP